MATHKSPKIDALLDTFDDLPDFNRHYAGFFRCFNAQLYYEAHDVLEEVWLPIRGQAQAKFYQGLIQMAGGFVHLQKSRLGPAARLFALALANFAPYPRAPRRHRPRGAEEIVPRASAGHPRLRRDGESVERDAAAGARLADRGESA